MKKTSKGITLVALVITIIVLLILAGISIATLTGENGIITKATKAKEEYQEDNYYKTLIETLLKNTPSDMKINVRKQYFFKLVVGDLNDSQHRLGILF